MGQGLDIRINVPVKSVDLDLRFDAPTRADGPVLKLNGSAQDVRDSGSDGQEPGAQAPTQAHVNPRSRVAQPHFTARLLNTETPSSGSLGMFLGGTTLVSGGAWASTASGGGTQVLKNIAHVGGKIVRLHPAARVVGPVATAAVLAYERGWLDRFRPITHEPKNIGASTHNMMPRPPGPAVELETFGDQQEVKGPTITGGSGLPEILQDYTPKGYQAAQTAQASAVLPGRQMLAPERADDNGGFNPIDAPQRGDNILWAKKHQDGNTKRKGMADYPDAPKPRNDLSAHFDVREITLGGRPKDRIEYTKIRDLFSGDVFRDNGALYFTVQSHRSANGYDLFTNAIQVLKQRGIDVFSIHGQWINPRPYKDNQIRFLETLKTVGPNPASGGDMSRADRETIAAASTFTGRIAKKYGFMPTAVTNNSSQLSAIFESSIDAKMRVMAQLGPTFYKNIIDPPPISIDHKEVNKIADTVTIAAGQQWSRIEISHQPDLPEIASAITKFNPVTNTLVWSSQSDRATVDFLGAEVSATVLAGMLQKLGANGYSVEQVLIDVTDPSTTYKGFHFLREDASLSEADAVNRMPIVQAFQAAGFEPVEIDTDFQYDRRVVVTLSRKAVNP